MFLESMLLVSEVLNCSCNYVITSIYYVYIHSVIVVIQSYFDIVFAKAYIYFSDESLHDKLNIYCKYYFASEDTEL